MNENTTELPPGDIARLSIKDPVVVEAILDTKQKPSLTSYLDNLRATMIAMSVQAPTLKAMLYGVSGVGKSVASLQIAQAITPPSKRIAYLDTAEGWVSFLNHPELITSRVIRMRYAGKLTHIDALIKAISDKEPGFEDIGCIIVDEASSTGDIELDTVLATRAAADRAKDPDTPTQPDYNTTTNKMRRTYMRLLSLDGVHVILVSHTRKDKDNLNVEVQSPSFLPKLGQKIKQPLHLIAHLSGNQIEGSDKEPEYKRIFQVHPTRRIDAKTRIGGLPVQVEYDQLVARIQDWLKNGAQDEVKPAIQPDHDPENPTVEPVEIEGD